MDLMKKKILVLAANGIIVLASMAVSAMLQDIQIHEALLKLAEEAKK